jgi:hypothetical protein
MNVRITRFLSIRCMLFRNETAAREFAEAAEGGGSDGFGSRAGDRPEQI